MSNELIELYKEFDSYIRSEIDTENLTNPLYIKYDFDNGLKVMFIGQETFDWCGKFGNKTIESLANEYENFFIDGECYKTRGGSFWNEIKYLSNAIQEKYNDEIVKSIWNNILKIGKYNDKGAPKENVNYSILKYPVLKREIEIINPDIVIFFTGPNYDKYIDLAFDNPLFVQLNDAINTRQLARVQSHFLPSKSFRTYHPKYLNRRGKDFKNNIRKAIMENI